MIQQRFALPNSVETGSIAGLLPCKCVMGRSGRGGRRGSKQHGGKRHKADYHTYDRPETNWQPSTQHEAAPTAQHVLAALEEQRARAAAAAVAAAASASTTQDAASAAASYEPAAALPRPVRGLVFDPVTKRYFKAKGLHHVAGCEPLSSRVRGSSSSSSSATPRKQQLQQVPPAVHSASGLFSHMKKRHLYSLSMPQHERRLAYTAAASSTAFCVQRIAIQQSTNHHAERPIMCIDALPDAGLLAVGRKPVTAYKVTLDFYLLLVMRVCAVVDTCTLSKPKYIFLDVSK
jgi:hypothetical protein